MRPFVLIEWLEKEPVKIHIDKLRTTEYQELYIQTAMEEISNVLPDDAHIQMELFFENTRIHGEFTCDAKNSVKTIRLDGEYIQDVMKDLHSQVKSILPAYDLPTRKILEV